MEHIDWTNLAQVLCYARRLAANAPDGMYVVRYSTRSNYNIMHPDRYARVKDCYTFDYVKHI